MLDQQRHAHIRVRYFEGFDERQLELVLFLDHAQVDQYLNISQSGFLWYFGAFPAILMLALYFIVRTFVLSPLTELRQFAYYHDRVPPGFKIRELESIRYTLRDTFQRLEQEQQILYHSARLDSLSGLANRHALQEYVNSLISECQRQEKEFAFLFLDFDNFKAVNDSMGHEIGDEVIREASKLIASDLRLHDFAARVGGDEFVMVIKTYNSKEELGRIVQRIQIALATHSFGGDHKLQVGSSVGIAFYPQDGSDFMELMKNSDIAMFAAKAKRNSGYHFFSHDLNKRVQENIALDKAMRAALRDGEYQLYCQPKIALDSGDFVGAEALLRWIKADGTVISPDAFIPLAEENGFIIELGAWVLREAVSQLAIWNQQGMPIKLAVNIATRQLLEHDFEQKLLSCMDEFQVPYQQLELEITEYLFIEQTKNNSFLIERLRSHGFSISLDDFGTGYSSLSYLKKFEVDEIKIDKTFVDDYTSVTGAIFLETIVRLGHALHKKVVAEGVETSEQAAHLRALGCHSAQGYLFSKPLPISGLETFYKASKKDL